MTPQRPRPGLVVAGIAAVAAGAFALWPIRPRTITAPAIERAEPEKDLERSIEIPEASTIHGSDLQELAG